MSQEVKLKTNLVVDSNLNLGIDNEAIVWVSIGKWFTYQQISFLKTKSVSIL